MHRRDFAKWIAGAALTSRAQAQTAPAGTLALGSRRELFIDDFLIDRLSGARLRLHSPERRNLAQWWADEGDRMREQLLSNIVALRPVVA
jgi:hypothetical protein